MTPVTEPIPCPDCSGEGYIEHSTDHYSYRSGHYTSGWAGGCDACSGTGMRMPDCGICGEKACAVAIDETWTDQPKDQRGVCGHCLAELEADGQQGKRDADGASSHA